MMLNDDLSIEKLEDEDEALLVKWLSDPQVLMYYEGRDNPFDLQKVKEKFYSDDDCVTRCIIHYKNKPIGYLQYYLLDQEEKSNYDLNDSQHIIYGMDQFIGETDYWEKGLGTRLIQGMVKFLTGELKADLITLDPEAWNTRAIRCYEKCGFNKVRLLPENEWHEGKWRDCWLMVYSS